jgi:hypothetical protein
MFECPHANALWKLLAGTLRHLIGPHNFDSKVIIYGYNPSTSTAQQLANYLLVLGKSTIYKHTWQQMQNTDYHPITADYYSYDSDIEFSLNFGTLHSS